MRISVWAVVLAVLFVSTPVAEAQFSAELQKRLEQLQSKPAASWTESDFRDMERTVLAMTREMLINGMTGAQRARLQSVPIRAIDDDNAPPAWTDKNGIYVSSTALAELIGLGLYLGHDLYLLRGDEFPIPSSLLVHPYRTRPILPLLPHVTQLLLGIPQQLIRCPVNTTFCAEPQGSATILGTIGFVVAHEMGHRLLRHQEKKVHSLDEEISADREAWRLLLAVAPKASGDDDRLEDRIRAVVIASPFAVLRWLRDSSQRPADAGVMERRAEKLHEVAGDEYFGDPASLVEPEPIAVKLRNVAIQWTEDPSELFIDGVPVRPREIAAKTLRLLTPARIFARKDGRFAYTEVTTAGGNSQTAVLVFVAPLADDSSREQLAELRRGRQWFKLFLATTTQALQPRSSLTAFEFYQALHNLGVDSEIDASNPGLAEHRGGIAITRRWSAKAQPLGTWRPAP